MADRKFDIQLKDKSRNLLYPLAHKDSSGNVIATTFVKKSGDTMTGNLSINGAEIIVSKSSGPRVSVTNSNGVSSILHVGTGGSNHGVISPGYYDGTTFHESEKWLIYRNSSGNVIVNGKSTDNVLKSGDTMTGALTVESTILATSSITSTGGNLSASKGNVWAGTAGDTTAERDIGVRSGAGNLYLYSQASSTGNRGLYADAHGTGSAKAVISVDTNNNVTFNGNATSATSATSATNATNDGDGNTITSYYCTLSTAQTISGTKTFSSEVKMTASGTSDICPGILAAFKTNRAQVTNLITSNIYAGTSTSTATSSQDPIIFYKYGSISSQAPATTTQLAKIDLDGNIYEGSTKLSSKYLALSGGTVTGTLTLSRTQDASGDADNKPALIVGGASTAQHIEMDGNEILSKENDTTPGVLWLQDSSGTVKVGGTGGLIIGATNSDTGFRCRNISYGTGDPSGGSSGDIYIKYTA